jgi:hypothetical protein
MSISLYSRQILKRHDFYRSDIKEKLCTKPLNGQIVDVSRISTTIPIIQGDSGSPLVDQDVRLCGVMRYAGWVIWRKLPPESVADMHDPDCIEELIDRDRRTHDTTGTQLLFEKRR